MWPSSGALGTLGSVRGLSAWHQEAAPHGGAWVDGMADSVAEGAQGGMTYDEAQSSPRPCLCQRLVSRPEQCAGWRRDRQTEACPLAVMHGKGKP